MDIVSSSSTPIVSDGIFTTTMIRYLVADTPTTLPTPPLQNIINPIADEEHHNQITFQIPTARDLEHIDRLHHFNTLLKRIGNVAYDTIAQHHQINHWIANKSTAAVSGGLTHDQISKSVVLDLADLKDNTENSLERYFAGSDVHSIINYLWIGVVTSLVVLSVVFVLFSCYFYRKFRIWKKCNKEVNVHLRGDRYFGGTRVPCDDILPQVCPEEVLLTNGMTTPAGAAAVAAAAYYQMQSPPCYTIATGLPSYDEALHHHSQQHQHQRYAFGMKLMYPSIASVNYLPHHQQPQTCMLITAGDAAGKQHQQRQQRHSAIKDYYNNTIAHCEKEAYGVRVHQKQRHQHLDTQQCEEKCTTIANTANRVVHVATTPPSYHEAAAAAASVLLRTEITDRVTKEPPRDDNATDADDTAKGVDSKLNFPAAGNMMMMNPGEIVIAMDQVLTTTEPNKIGKATGTGTAVARTTTTTSSIVASSSDRIQSTNDYLAVDVA